MSGDAGLGDIDVLDLHPHLPSQLKLMTAYRL